MTWDSSIFQTTKKSYQRTSLNRWLKNLKIPKATMILYILHSLIISKSYLLSPSPGIVMIFSDRTGEGVSHFSNKTITTLSCVLFYNILIVLSQMYMFWFRYFHNFYFQYYHVLYLWINCYYFSLLNQIQWLFFSNQNSFYFVINKGPFITFIHLLYFIFKSKGSIHVSIVWSNNLSSLLTKFRQYQFRFIDVLFCLYY